MSIADKRYLSDAAIEHIRACHRVERTIDEALTAKLRRRRGADYRLPPMSELEGRLDAFLATRLPGTFQIDGLKRLPGGGSKEMFRFKLRHASGAGQADDADLILRMSPGESIVETYRAREFEVIAAMKGVVPVPGVRWVDSDGSFFGNSALICDVVSGVAKPTTKHGDGGQVSGIGAGFPQRLRETLFPEFVDHLATIHNFNWKAAALPSFDIPSAGSTDAAALALHHWSRVWEEDSFEEHPVITLARRWLTDHLPAVDEICLIHNDYRSGNFLFDEARGAITAILDWELARLGDIHEDLAWVLFPGFAAPDEAGNALVCGLGTRDAFLERYERMSGKRVDARRLHYYTVLNLYKLAILGSATNIRAASDRQSHLDVMMNFSTGLGCAALSGLYQMINAAGATP